MSHQTESERRRKRRFEQRARAAAKAALAAPPVRQTCRCELEGLQRFEVEDEDGERRCWKCGKVPA